MEQKEQTKTFLSFKFFLPHAMRETFDDFLGVLWELRAADNSSLYSSRLG
jgi:hypothetical protein